MTVALAERYERERLPAAEALARSRAHLEEMLSRTEVPALEKKSLDDFAVFSTPD